MKKHKPKDYNFADRADVYDSGLEGKLSRKFYNLIMKEIKLTSGAAVLDVGSGTGALLGMLANVHKIKGHGIDAEEKMLAVAKKNFPQMNFQSARCDKVPFGDKTFDAVISCLSFHHFDNREGFAKEAGRILKPDGVLYIADVCFPWLIRKILNGIFRIAGRVGRFYSPKEIINHFTGEGFVNDSFTRESHAQIVMLRKL